LQERTEKPTVIAPPSVPFVERGSDPFAAPDLYTPDVADNPFEVIDVEDTATGDATLLAAGTSASAYDVVGNAKIMAAMPAKMTLETMLSFLFIDCS
jgi:hypothetical protein